MKTIRCQQILALLRKHGHIVGKDLEKRFGITAMTVWRDLCTLEELGLLRRVRGGAEPLASADPETFFEIKSVARAGAKRQIAACAAAHFINEGDTIVLEGGSTVAALIEFLPRSHITILTNSAPVALQVRARRPDLPVRVAGGWLSPVSGNLTGPETLRDIAKLSADCCFLGATAFDAEVGPTDPNPLEVEAKRAWAAIARRTVLLLDHRKFGHRSACVTIHPRRLHAVVSEAPPPRAIAALLATHSVRYQFSRTSEKFP